MTKMLRDFLSLCSCASVAAAATAADLGDIKLNGPLGERLDRMIERHVGGTDVDYITACFQEKTERKFWWQTEFWGKYMHAAVPFADYSGSAKIRADIERGVARVLASQEKSGYIGNYPDELRCGEGWDVWGMKYTMLGLMHYYDAVVNGEWGTGNGETGNGEWGTGNGERGTEAARVLDAAKRLCDYVIGEIGPGGKRGRELWQTGNWSGLASSSILEPVVWLYRRVAAAEGAAAAQKYLDFATSIVKGMSEPAAGPRLVDLALQGVSVADRNGHGNVAETHGGYVCKHNRWKAYEMMSCYQGLLEYVECVNEPNLLSVIIRDNPWLKKLGGLEALRRAALMTAEDIVKEEVSLAGGCACSEAWFHGAKKQHLPYRRLQETCVTTTWMRFCEKLLDLTGDPKWADQIERTFYNVYLAAMKADGSEFAGYTPLTGNRYHGQHHCYMHTDCCTANGPRGFLCFLRELFRARGDAAEFNFYASALVKGELADGRALSFEMYTLYPRTGSVRIVSHTKGVGTVPVRFRIPAWADRGASVTLNGKAMDGVKAGAYFTVAHEWRLGDVVELTFKMPVVAHVIADRPASVPGAFAGKDAMPTIKPHYVAFTRGPVLLARDSRLDRGDFTEPFHAGAVSEGKVMEGFSSVRSPSDEIWMAFSAVLPIGSHHENPEGRLGEAVTFCDYASAGNSWRRDDYYRTWFPVEWGPTE